MPCLALADAVGSVVSALKEHPRVLAAQARVLLAEADAKREKASQYPRVIFSTDGGRQLFGNAGVNQSRALGDRGFVDGIVSARQQLFDFGATRSRIDSAVRQAEAEAITPTLELNSLIQETLERVSRLVVSQQLLALSKATQQGIREQADLARIRYEKGLTNASIYRRLLLSLDRLEQDAINAKAEVDAAQVEIAELLGLPVDELLQFFEQVDLSLPEMNRQGLSSLQIEYRRQAATYQVKAAEAERLPSIALELESRFFDLDKSLAADYEVTGNVVVTVPFFDGGARAARQAAAEFETIALEREAEFSQRVLNERAGQVQLQIATLEATVASLEQQADSLAESLKLSQLRQGQTEVGIDELAAGLMNLYDNQVARARARGELVQRTVEAVALAEFWPQRLALMERKAQ